MINVTHGRENPSTNMPAKSKLFPDTPLVADTYPAITGTVAEGKAGKITVAAVFEKVVLRNPLLLNGITRIGIKELLCTILIPDHVYSCRVNHMDRPILVVVLFVFNIELTYLLYFGFNLFTGAQVDHILA